jgi:hypothetical protein
MEIVASYEDEEVTEEPAASGLMCNVCGDRERLYKCPRCGVFSCSLACCKRHKVEKSCNGRRDRSAFVPMSGFGDANLRNDYHFLEDLLQTKESAKRTLTLSCGGLPQSGGAGGKRRNHGGNKRQRSDSEVVAGLEEGGGGTAVTLTLLPGQQTKQVLDAHTQGVRNFVEAAAGAGRGTRVIVMSPGMTKRRANTSHYRSKVDEIVWKVHAVFVVMRDGAPPLPFDPAALLRPELETTSESAVSIFTLPEDSSGQSQLVGMSLRGVSEQQTLLTVLEGLLGPQPTNSLQRHSLRSLRQASSHIVCFIRSIPSPAAQPVFCELDVGLTIRQALANRTVVEYPTFVFALPKTTRHLRRWVAPAQEEQGEGEVEMDGIAVNALALGSPSKTPRLLEG